MQKERGESDRGGNNDSLKPGLANWKKNWRLAPNFLQKYLPIVARNRAGAPDCTCYIIYQYAASTAHLTNHDTRHAHGNSRHIKEPGEMSLCSFLFVTSYPV